MRLKIVSNLHSFIPAHMLNQWCERAFGIFPLKLHADHEIKWAGRTAAHSDAVKLLPMRRDESFLPLHFQDSLFAKNGLYVIN